MYIGPVYGLYMYVCAFPSGLHGERSRNSITSVSRRFSKHGFSKHGFSKHGFSRRGFVSTKSCWIIPIFFTTFISDTIALLTCPWPLVKGLEGGKCTPRLYHFQNRKEHAKLWNFPMIEST